MRVRSHVGHCWREIRRTPGNSSLMISAPRKLILEVRGLRKSFGGTEVLKGINFTVEPQELVFIMGPSGAGKSTFLRCLNRLEEPTEGSIFVDGIDLLHPKTDINATRRRIGMVFQAFNLYPHMTALGNVTLALRKVIGLANAQAEATGYAALDRVGLKDKARAYPNELSGGQQQRVAIARALVNHPSILLADEPTGNLDSRTSVEIMDILQRLNEDEGLTVVLVTHEPDIAAYSQRSLEFRDGKMKRDTRIKNRLIARLVLPTLKSPDDEDEAEANESPEAHPANPAPAENHAEK